MLYAPGLRDLDTIRQVAAAVSKPLNVVMSAADPALTRQQLEAAGVKRISVGGALKNPVHPCKNGVGNSIEEKACFDH